MFYVSVWDCVVPVSVSVSVTVSVSMSMYAPVSVFVIAFLVLDLVTRNSYPEYRYIVYSYSLV